jgi:hypothetical protein
LVENVEKKLREARFFLEKMDKHERIAFVDKEPFDFYLSAFLNAGMSVRGAFHVRQDRKRNEAIKKWKRKWEAQVTPNEKSLWDFMLEDRIHEVHISGSRRIGKTENRELGPGTHSLAGGTHEVSAPPDVFPAAIIRTHAYYFTIDGTDRKVTEACWEYLALLEQMVAKFKADHT